jgi:hypothetical protein
MKRFTVRDLDRNPGIVLESADRHGMALIECRDGRSYVIRPVMPPSAKMGRIPDLAARRKAIFEKRISAAQCQLADKLLAGE